MGAGLAAVLKDGIVRREGEARYRCAQLGTDQGPRPHAMPAHAAEGMQQQMRPPRQAFLQPQLSHAAGLPQSCG